MRTKTIVSVFSVTGNSTWHILGTQKFPVKTIVQIPDRKNQGVRSLSLNNGQFTTGNVEDS